MNPEDQQVEICLLKTNLEKITNDLVLQGTELPGLDAENEQRYRETMNALKMARTLNGEIERLKQENVRLTAVRVQRKRECEALDATLAGARAQRSRIQGDLKAQEETQMTLIRNYEDSLREKADRFRRTRTFYDENAMAKELDNATAMNIQLEKEKCEKQQEVDTLRRQLEGLQPSAREDLLDLVGKKRRDGKLKSLEENLESLRRKRNFLINSKMISD